jgi:Epoxide hydrolase N terminus
VQINPFLVVVLLELAPPATEVVMTCRVQTPTEIRPFNVDIPEAGLTELRRRIAAARWPTKELVEDPSQGVQLATLQGLARHWGTTFRSLRNGGSS